MTSVSQSEPRRRLLRPAVPVIVAVLLVSAVVATLLLRDMFASPDPLAEGTVVPVSSGELVAGVTATGAVEPQLSAELAFEGVGGIVREVAVFEGDTVLAGDLLVQLDTRELQTQLAQAEAALAVAQADVAALREGATAEELAEAEAQIEAARGSLTQVQGSVTSADIASARAAVTEAEARLAELQAGPRNDELTRAQTALADAQSSARQQRATLSAAKEQANRNVQTAANEVREAQSAYSTAYWDLQHVRNNETDPRTGRGLSDFEVQDFVVAFENAELRLANAEKALAQAQIDYERTMQDEISGIEQTDAQIARAQADLDELLSGPASDELAAAQAQLARARADLARLTSAERQGAIESQAANLAAAEARREQLLADPRASDLARAEARVAQAEAELARVQLSFDSATLRAPFAGTIAAVNVAPGEAISGASPITLIDESLFLVKVTVDEVDVTRVAVGQPVEVLIDALGAPALEGEVKRIEPQSQPDSAVTSYLVTVEIDPADRALRSGMTASATIIADSREDALTLPLRAVRNEDGRSLVTLVERDGEGNVTLVDREVETGLRSGDRIEIVSGLSTGDEVFIANGS